MFNFQNKKRNGYKGTLSSYFIWVFFNLLLDFLSISFSIVCFDNTHYPSWKTGEMINNILQLWLTRLASEITNLTKRINVPKWKYNTESFDNPIRQIRPTFGELICSDKKYYWDSKICNLTLKLHQQVIAIT